MPVEPAVGAPGTPVDGELDDVSPAGLPSPTVGCAVGELVEVPVSVVAPPDEDDPGVPVAPVVPEAVPDPVAVPVAPP